MAERDGPKTRFTGRRVSSTHDIQLASTDWQRLFVWLDISGQRSGSFGHEQEEHLRRLRQHPADLPEK
ncbi:MAG: hypothetical protein EA424_18255 [Planctomycetaceae bacterium]|nr:MAG: hypothetical protein EA424_18255 [Planctomycetaceae bacterium]